MELLSILAAVVGEPNPRSRMGSAFVEAVEDLTERRIFIGALQEQNHGDNDGKLKQRESDYATDWSRQQFDYAHGRSSNG